MHARLSAVSALILVTACGALATTEDRGSGAGAGSSSSSGGLNGSGSSSSGSGVPPGGDCAVDSDCPFDQHCEAWGEGGSCAEGAPPTTDAGHPDAGDTTVDVLLPVDPACAHLANAQAIFPPKKPALQSTVPGDCRSGFELNNPPSTMFTLGSAGSRALALEVDFATYLAPDALTITGIMGNGSEYLLFDTCRLQTAEYIDPTGGLTRPPEDSIRDYRPNLREGTVGLKFNYVNATSPTYLRIVGLCDFDLAEPPGVEANRWRLIP